MSIVAHTRPFVIGVDAHARTHALAVLACPTGEVLDEAQFPATTAGLARAVAWVARRTGADLDALWVIEGVGTYGARLARAAADAGYAVAEAPRMNARANRGVGKSDPLDARRIAQAALPLDHTQLRLPRTDEGARAALRILVASRDHITNERTAAINALIALLRVVDLGIDARGTLNTGRISEIAAWRARAEELSIGVARAEAVRLAKRVRTADRELGDLTRQMTALLNESPAAGLLDQPGIGPVTAAIAYAAWSHPGRIRSEAAFASLAGVNPIPASSGNTVRHRINRGGDRRLNRALHMAVVTRMRMDPETRAYVDKRTAQGRTPREIRRSLKRYLARQIYRQLNATITPSAAA
ncbi:transposase (plasmid) [Rhodococcus sp. p52]|uniref:IS110 family transposase n=1 Tax=Rhodococcus sp. p52 TaxID=935199 RepID=UPI00051A3095|nr:IS110 family transposase [Rhodococcus sp. p52]AOD24886.1 transposase [Rhodococcus sp. p52]